MGLRIGTSKKHNYSKYFLEEEKKNAELDSMIQFVEINKGSRDCKTWKNPFSTFFVLR